MSTTIESIYGSKWEVSRDADGRVAIHTGKDVDGATRIFQVSDLLAALKSEGLLEDALPTDVKYLPEYVAYSVDGIRVPGGPADFIRQKGLAPLAVANHIEAEDALAAGKAEALTQRRNKAASRVGFAPIYETLNSSARMAIDRIIDLEDQLAEK